MQQTLILGIGNTLLTDEGLGIHLLDYLREHHADQPGVTYLDGGTLSFTLAPDIEDCENLIVPLPPGKQGCADNHQPIARQTKDNQSQPNSIQKYQHNQTQI